MTDELTNTSTPTHPEQATSENNHVNIWDLPTRAFHWLLVLSMVAAFVTNWLGVSYFKYHLWCGYFVIILVCFRILWGFVGTHHAQFQHFVHHPINTLKYGFHFVKGKAKHYPGHNPLGAVMVLVLLLAILVQAVTGLFSNDEIFNLGPLYGYVSNELSLTLTSLHRQLFYWILGAVALHVLAVLFHVFVKRDNIIKAMITGKKSGSHHAEAKSIESSRLWLALGLIVLLSGILAWIIISAPEAALDMGF